jgi:hypothetical protein
MKQKYKVLILASLFSINSYAETESVAKAEVKSETEVQDMSDPLAVYTQAGVGATNLGMNVKIGRSYDPGKPNFMAMNLIEIKGLLGETLGWDNLNREDNSVDNIRFRNFKVDTTTGRGAQIDFIYNFDETHIAKNTGELSYSFMQALPKMGIVNLYPLAGLGASFGKDAVETDGTIDDGFSFNGTYALLGMYGKITLSEKIWINYNPFWLTTLSGTSQYKDNAYGADDSNVLTHEFVLSYQINPKLNVRYFANWNENLSFSDGGHRIEVNYQM